MKRLEKRQEDFDERRARNRDEQEKLCIAQVQRFIDYATTTDGVCDKAAAVADIIEYVEELVPSHDVHTDDVKGLLRNDPMKYFVDEMLQTILNRMENDEKFDE